VEREEKERREVENRGDGNKEGGGSRVPLTSLILL